MSFTTRSHARTPATSGLQPNLEPTSGNPTRTRAPPNNTSTLRSDPISSVQASPSTLGEDPIFVSNSTESLARESIVQPAPAHPVVAPQENPPNIPQQPAGAPDGAPGPDDGDDNGEDNGSEHHNSEPDQPAAPPANIPNELEGLSIRELLLLLGQGMRPQPAAVPVTPAAPRRIKINPPEEFTGRDPKKLKSFLVSCNLVFRSDPAVFVADDKRVNYALSYLRGSAQRHFDGQLEDEEDENFIAPPWLENWPLFVKELKDMFGDPNAEATAEAELDALRMRPSQKFTDFLVEFNSIASQVNWGDRALHHRLRQALPDRIKDSLALMEEPADFA